MTSSPLFWLLALALAVATLATLLMPLVRRRGELPPEEEVAAAAVFRDHRRQVEADFTAGTINAAERDAALEDLVARLGGELADPAMAPKVTPGSDRPQWVFAVVIAGLLPVVAGGLYYLLGNPAALAPQPALAAQGDASINDPQMQAMVEGLAKRLQANPDDGNGWAMLGRSYRALGRLEAAALAFGEAAKRLPPNAALLTDWAETVAQAQGRSLAGQPTELIDRALKIDPDYPKALALSGAAAMERNEPAAAVVLWKRLKTVLPPGSPEIAQIDSVVAQIEGTAPAAKAGGAVSAPKNPPPAVGPKAAGPAPSASGGAASTAGAVEGRVEFDPKLASRVSPGDTVFIFARDPDGSRMPLAAIKLAAGDLPKDFLLTDAMAMSASAVISAAKRVVIEARITKSGQATPQSGDLAGTSAPVAPGARKVRVVIDKIIP